MPLPIIAIFGNESIALDHACFETRYTESASAQAIEEAIASSDGVIIDGTSPISWFTVAVALEKYGRPTALVTNTPVAFAASITHPTFITSADIAAVNAFFTKHFPAPVDPDCRGDVCRI